MNAWQPLLRAVDRLPTRLHFAVTYDADEHLPHWAWLIYRPFMIRLRDAYQDQMGTAVYQVGAAVLRQEPPPPSPNAVTDKFDFHCSGCGSPLVLIGRRQGGTPVVRCPVEHRR